MTAGTRAQIVNRKDADCFSPGHVSAPRLGVAVAEIAAALSRLAETQARCDSDSKQSDLVNAPRHAVDQMPNRLAVPDNRMTRNGRHRAWLCLPSPPVADRRLKTDQVSHD